MKSKFTKFAVAAVIIIAIAIGINQLGNSSVAWAKLVQPILTANTASFDVTFEFQNEPSETVHFLCKASGQMRQNTLTGITCIIDYQKCEMLTLNAQGKTAKIQDIRNDTEEGVPLNMLEKVQRLIEATLDPNNKLVSYLGRKTIDGQKAEGFQTTLTGDIQSIGWLGKGDFTVWVNEETKLPLIIEWYSDMFKLRTIISHITLNVCIDESDFSMQIPEGYILQTEEPRETADSNTIANQEITDEQKIIRGLKSWTILSGGRFPSSLTIDAIKDFDPNVEASMSIIDRKFSVSWSNLDFFKNIIDIPEIDGNNPPSKKQLEQINKKYQKELNEKFKPIIDDIFTCFYTILKLPAKSNWHYAGKGVELGDANTAIFWYLPLDSNTYHTIYGDLKIDDGSDKQTMIDMALNISGAKLSRHQKGLVSKILNLGEKDLIYGLGAFLELSGGFYPGSLDLKLIVKETNAILEEQLNQSLITKKRSEEKAADVFFVGAYYDKLVKQKMEPVYYGNGLTVENGDRILMRWKISDNQYRVIYGNLTAGNISSGQLAELETSLLK
ncbi:MAG: hypothetical protein ACYC54_00970 [Sedimentisphaerales bacterium]